MHLTYRSTCRVCGSTALTKVIDLGEQHLQGSFWKPGAKKPPMRRIPTQLFRCDPTRDEKACGLLQMPYTVPPAILYSAYWYRSGTNQTMRDHLKGIAETVTALLRKDRAAVLDIGCNDGTLLRAYDPRYERVGVDPSDATAAIEPPIRVVKDVFPSPELSALMDGRRFDAITSIAMFYDLEDPVAFVKEISQSLAPDGLWVFEMSYMPSMLKLNSYDTICHEHLEYYSLAVVEGILQRAGMKLVSAELNDINGGSIRCYATHLGNLKFKDQRFGVALEELRAEEFDLELDTDKPYRDFQARIEDHRRDLSTLIRDLKREGKKIHVYGASTKGNTILQWCGLDHTVIDCAADRNPDKDGASTLGTNIPIVSEEKSRAMNPDYYLVLPWHFKKEFLERERETLDRGIGMIFPLPTIEVVKRDPAPVGAGARAGRAG